MSDLLLTHLTLGWGGRPLGTLGNITAVLRADPDLQGLFRDHARGPLFPPRVVITRRAPWDADGLKYPRHAGSQDGFRLRILLEQRYGLSARDKTTWEGIETVARDDANGLVRP